jgi:site-specific recombinase XerD
MPPVKSAFTPSEIYDQALKYSRDTRLSPGVPQPGYTRDWLPENVAALERYWEWLSGGGTSPYVIRIIHIPMAGHILSMNHKPSGKLDLEQDLQKAMDYILAKGLGTSWTHNCRLSMLKFRRFLLHERGLVECKVTPYDPAPRTVGLPAWLVEQLACLQRIQQCNWREARLEQNINRFWCGHLRLWRFLCERCQVKKLSDLKRSHFMEYIDWRLATHAAVRSINADLRSFRGFMGFLQEQGLPVPHTLLRLRCLKEPDPLPRFLTDAQVCALRDDLENNVKTASGPAHHRDALLDRACFYLCWQSGLRKGEVEDLCLEDLDLEGRKMTIRRGKGLVDRTVFLTDAVVHALRDYLAVRGPGPTGHVFLYRNQAISKDIIHSRLKACGERVGVPVYAHRLRHTCATQLLNAGCQVTSIQKFLGHKRLNTTMIYARAHDQTVADDYYRAMRSVERRLNLLGEVVAEDEPVADGERAELLALAVQLAQPELSFDLRLEMVAHMRRVLNGQNGQSLADGSDIRQRSPPPLFATLDSVAVG